MDQIERESNSIFKLSHGAAAFGDKTLESVLQEKEVLVATVQSLKDLLSQVDQARANAQVCSLGYSVLCKHSNSDGFADNSLCCYGLTAQAEAPITISMAFSVYLPCHVSHSRIFLTLVYD